MEMWWKLQSQHALRIQHERSGSKGEIDIKISYLLVLLVLFAAACINISGREMRILLGGWQI
jgi:hypothetical protein